MSLFWYRKRERWAYAIPILFVLVTYLLIHNYTLRGGNDRGLVGSDFYREMIDKRARSNNDNSFNENFEFNIQKIEGGSGPHSSIKETDVYIIEEHHEGKYIFVVNFYKII